MPAKALGMESLTFLPRIRTSSCQFTPALTCASGKGSYTGRLRALWALAREAISHNDSTMSGSDRLGLSFAQEFFLLYRIRLECLQAASANAA